VTEENKLENIKDILTERFEVWLDRVLAYEEIPSGIPSEILAELQDGDSSAGSNDKAGDLYSVYAAMTALVQEIRLQGRAFKQLSDNLDPIRNMGGALDAALAAHQEALTEARRIADEALAQKTARDRSLIVDAEAKANRSFLILLVELHERLKRGLEPARQLAVSLSKVAHPSWRRRLAGVTSELGAAYEKARVVERGANLTIERLGEMLGDYGVHEIECVGLPFDPVRMRADDVEETQDVPDGTVLEIYRAGYEARGEVFQAARVKVARNRNILRADQEADSEE
jgi:molecular chaperone GrpE